MRKNKMMRLASALLVAVLLTTCAISGTFAKYVTEASATDTARVAKFGVTVSATGNMFAKSYGTTVESANEDKLVAPGTNGDLAAVTISGATEVSVKVYQTDVDLTLTGWTAGGGYYCPLVIYVNGTPYYGMKYATATEFEEAVEGAIEAVTNTYAPKADLSGGSLLNVSWAWSFNPYDAKQTDALDTELGRLADAGSAPSVKLFVKTIVEQVD